MMTTERPILSQESVTEDIQRFINYLRGNEHISNSINIPNTFVDNINKKLQLLSPIRSIAKVTTTSNDKLDVVIDNNSSESSGWVTNSLLQTKDNSCLSKISIYLYQLYSKLRVAFSLLEDDSAKVEEVIQDKITLQVAATENKAFLYGDGINQPKGILKYNITTKDYKIDSKTIEGVTGGNNGTIDYSKLIELMDKLNTKYLYNAYWLMSRNTASHIRNIKDQSSGKFIWQNAILQNMPDTLLGYPVVICEDMPSLHKDTKSYCSVLFGNFYEGYQIVEKPEIKLLKDPYNAKPFVEFYATKRVGGDVIDFNAIKALVLQ